jgi:biotin transport system substrate-specific component
LPAVFIIGFISEKFKQRFIYDIIAMLCGTVVIYALGVIQLKIVLGKTWMVTMVGGVVPFIIFDIVKVVAAAVTAKAVRPIIMNK